MSEHFHHEGILGGFSLLPILKGIEPVVYFSLQLLFQTFGGLDQALLMDVTQDEQIHVACGPLLVSGEGTVNESSLNPGEGGELASDGFLQAGRFGHQAFKGYYAQAKVCEYSAHPTGKVAPGKMA